MTSAGRQRMSDRGLDADNGGRGRWGGYKGRQEERGEREGAMLGEEE